uniref:ORF82 n=1 Tax=Malaco herpesvirus 1 TaxID=3031797 RepID=A0AA48P7T5_9VIRU|nr:TPA_asm: ORF82 [Malaco herpesvirus 1]
MGMEVWTTLGMLFCFMTIVISVSLITTGEHVKRLTSQCCFPMALSIFLSVIFCTKSPVLLGSIKPVSCLPILDSVWLVCMKKRSFICSGVWNPHSIWIILAVSLR